MTKVGKHSSRVITYASKDGEKKSLDKIKQERAVNQIVGEWRCTT